MNHLSSLVVFLAHVGIAYYISSSLAVTMEVQAINCGNAFSLHGDGNTMVRVSVKVLKKEQKIKTSP